MNLFLVQHKCYAQNGSPNGSSTDDNVWTGGLWPRCLLDKQNQSSTFIRNLINQVLFTGKELPLLSPPKAHYLQAGYLGPDYSNSLHQIKDSHHAINLLSCQAVALYYSEAAPQMDSWNKLFLTTHWLVQFASFNAFLRTL